MKLDFEVKCETFGVCDVDVYLCVVVTCICVYELCAFLCICEVYLCACRLVSIV